MSERELNRAIESLEQLLDRNRFVQAKTVLAEALPQFPNSETLVYFAGYVAWRCGELDDAELHARHLLALDPASYRGRLLMADICEDREQWADSERYLLSLLGDYPAEAVLIAQYGMLMLRTLHVEKAGKLAAEALRLDPQHVQAMHVATMASIVKGDIGERDERLTDMMRKYPEMQVTAAMLVQVLQRDGRYKESLRVSQDMLKAQPDDPLLVDLVLENKLLSHWSMLPLSPFMRYGWAASIGLWFTAVILFRVLPDSPITDTLLIVLLVFVVYSWVWPPVFRRILKR